MRTSIDKKFLDMAMRAFDRQARQTLEVSNIKASVDTAFGEQRRSIVRWLIRLNEKFEFYPETLFLSVAIFDRFLTFVKAQPKYLNCIGIACFYLAAKTLEEDNNLLDTLSLVRTSECGCSVAEVLRMERCVLSKLNWDLRLATPLEFLHIFHAMVMNQYPNALAGTTLSRSQHLARVTRCLQNCMLDPQVTGFAPSTIAFTVLSLDLKLLPWKENLTLLQQLTEVQLQEYEQCIKLFGKPAKRKVNEEDFYDGIKRLYSDDSAHVDALCIQPITCASELLRCTSVGPALGAAHDFTARVNN